MRLVVGLGNPGKEYARSRHNVGFLCLNHFARSHRLAFSQRQGKARLAQGVVDGMDILLAKPTTYMNRSGLAVAALVRRWKLPLAHLLVIYDDIDLPLGKIRLRPRGSAGGHHGMESIIAALGSQDFPRLRVGIGRPEGETGAINHVLGSFLPSEQGKLDEAVARISQALDCILTQGLEKAMSQYNRDDLTP